MPASEKTPMTRKAADPIWLWNTFDIGDGGEKGLPAKLWAESGQDLDIKGKLAALNFVADRNLPFPSEWEPDSIHINTHRPLRSRAFPDLVIINSLVPFISGATMELLRGFDVGETEIWELPFFDFKKRDPDGPPVDLVPDRDRPIPGRWGFLHLRARKTALVARECVGLRASGRTDDGVITRSFNLRSDSDVLAVDAVAANRGIDLWLDPQMPRVLFVTDRLKTEMEAEELNIPAFGDFKQAKLE